MVSQELIDEIASRFQRGENGKKIRETLISKGYEDGDITDAIKEIQKAALMQMPVYRFIVEKWHYWEEHTTDLSTRSLLFIFGFLLTLLVVIAVILYTVTDPLGKRPLERDQQRNVALAQMQTSLSRFYAKNGHFPEKLQELIPQYLAEPLVDPRTKDPYEYILSSDNQSYQLCALFEEKQRDCVSGDNQGKNSEVSIHNDPGRTSVPSPYTVYGLVFIDSNRNNIRDGGYESGYKGAAVKVLDKNGVSVCEAVSDADGNFTCGILQSGSYQVVLSVPASYEAVKSNTQPITFEANSDTNTLSVLFGLASTGKK